jgi:hypothetical protein
VSQPPADPANQSPAPEPRNPFYVLLLLAGLVFVLTALAYAVVPVLEEKARDMGETPPPSPWRDALRHDGWKWLLYEVAALVVFGLASMGLDRYRRYQKERHTATAPSPAAGVNPPPVREQGTDSPPSDQRSAP